MAIEQIHTYDMYVENALADIRSSPCYISPVQKLVFYPYSIFVFYPYSIFGRLGNMFVCFFVTALFSQPRYALYTTQHTTPTNQPAKHPLPPSPSPSLSPSYPLNPQSPPRFQFQFPNQKPSFSTLDSQQRLQ